MKKLPARKNGNGDHLPLDSRSGMSNLYTLTTLYHSKYNQDLNAFVND